MATLGWYLKLAGLAGADSCIVLGTGLVVAFCALALQQLVRRLNLPVLAPLALFGLGLALLTVETLAQPLSWTASLTLRLLGELLAASGTGWLLLRLNRVWDQKVAALRRLRRTR
ncbi:hypothetical protein GCM10022407_03390 [Hymenobacter antarcticus]|uniref:Uncharacterized protein n=1 Tax=Hymenobacter antarcticus TaxID=486270 RepID=A0ABP7P5I5_9BACT